MSLEFEPETPPTREQQLCEYVVDLANRGDDVATILCKALDVFGEDPPDGRRCRRCGCTDIQACPGGCWWIEPDLCSQCHQAEPYVAAVVTTEGSHVLLLSKARLSLEQADTLKRKLETRIPGVDFTVVDNVSAAVVVQP